MTSMSSSLFTPGQLGLNEQSQPQLPDTQYLDREEKTYVYAQVLLHLEHPGLASRVFTYRIPDEHQGSVQVGVPVLVPFGNMPSQLGYVVGLTDSYFHKSPAKAITEVIDDLPLFDAAYFGMLRFVADYYATPIHQVLSCALPSNLVQKIKKEIVLNLALAESIAVFKLPQSAQQALAFLKNQTVQVTPQALAKALKLDKKKLGLLLATLKQEGFIQVIQAQEGTTQEKTERVLHVNPDALAESVDSLTSKQRAIWDYLLPLKESPEKELLSACKTTRQTLQKLVDLSLVQIEQRAIFRDPLAYFQQVEKDMAVTLSEAQRDAVATIMAAEPVDPYVLYGVTGSGKTEVYLHLTRQTLEQGRAVLVMVPEIALTSQLAKRFIAFFGKENIALWHSHLSAGEKADTWRRLANGQLKILIAARSGVWAPFQNLGMVILDEEHEGSYKQDAPVPRYHARTVAEFRVKQSNARLVLGSATPDVATYHQARDAGRLIKLPERFGGRPMARVIVVDMKEERREGLKGNISKPLKNALAENLAKQEQSIIFINRRGFYTSLQCGHCDHVLTCMDCDVSLTFHKPLRQVRCHYCNYQGEAPQFCPVCASSAIHQTGVGTQRVEEELQKAFPDARILRMDTDTLSGKNSHHLFYQAFASGEADILIGTQIVAKGLDVANVTLVGVVAADSSFSLPDFKATERGFQLLTQVAGRAGRGQKLGRVIFQTALSDLEDNHHPVIRYSSEQNYEGFYDEEIQVRRAFQYPPYSQLCRMIFSAESEKTVQHFALATAAHLKQSIDQAGLQDRVLLVGPASCVIPRIQGRYRYHMMIKNMAATPGQQLITDFYRNLPPPEGIHFHLDVDSLSLL